MMLLTFATTVLFSFTHALRDIPKFKPPKDFRPRGCQNWGGKPTTKVSIIMPCLNEKFEHVMQTFLAIKEHSPDELIEEIIFISDGGDAFEEELKAISPKVKIIKHEQREGLIRSKKEGAAIAKGDIIVFYEPHVIAQKQWLEPIVEHIEKYPNAVAMPSLDVWDANGGFHKATTGYYRFEWNFNLMYTNQMNVADTESNPYPTPATAGGIFAIRKQFFLDLELYDEELRQWGGDHIELAFKVWRCGGRIDMFPCSRVAHLFRSEQERPYDVDVSRVVQNYARLAKVWLDSKYLSVFYKVKPEAKAMDAGNITSQTELKKKLKCKSMAWYLKNIDWEMGWESRVVCIPGATKAQGGCAKSTKPEGRTTLDRTMPSNDFLNAQLESQGLFLDDEFDNSDEL